MMMWKSATAHTLYVAGSGTSGLALLLFDHTTQYVSGGVRNKKPLCLSQGIAQVWSFNSKCAFLRVEHQEFILYIAEKNQKARLHIYCDSDL